MQNCNITNYLLKRYEFTLIMGDFNAQVRSDVVENKTCLFAIPLQFLK